MKIKYKLTKRDFIKLYGMNEWLKQRRRETVFENGTTLKEVVDVLTRIKNHGLNSYYVNFNGAILYVYNISLKESLKLVYNLDDEGLNELLNKEKKTPDEIAKKIILKKRN